MLCKQFWKNVLPSMIAFAFTGVYAVVDGFFVGRNVGDTGLAAINMAYPLVALLQATGCGIGMAGAIQIAICAGRGDQEGKRRNLGNSLIMLICAGVMLTVMLVCLYRPVLRGFGAEGTLLNYAGDYVRLIAAGALPQVLATGLVPIIRNYDGAIEAMLSMVAGFVTNIILDYLFVSVYGFGIAGAAVATVIGQMVTVVPCILFLILKVKVFSYARFRPKGSTVKTLFATAVSPFGLTLTPNIVILIMNKGAVTYGNDLAVSCYAVVSYITCVVYLLVQGIGDGAQPLIGRYYGSGHRENVKKVRSMAFSFGGLIALSGVVCLYLLRGKIAAVFGVSKEVADMFSYVILYFIAGLLFEAFLRITIAYFYAVENTRSAAFLIYGEPLFLAVLVAFAFPRFMGLEGVWLSVPAAQFSLAVIAGFLLKKSGHTSINQIRIDNKNRNNQTNVRDIERGYEENGCN